MIMISMMQYHDVYLIWFPLYSEYTVDEMACIDFALKLRRAALFATFYRMITTNSGTTRFYQI